MFDDDRLFRVLYHLANEPRDFLVAQDALAIMRSCINQIEDLEFSLNDIISRRDQLGPEFIESYQEHESCVQKLETLRNNRPELLERLIPLRAQAG